MYSGYAPFASGTVGTLFPAIPLYLLMIQLPVPVYAILTVGLFLASVYLGGQAEKLLGKKDPGKVTIDEVVGFLVTMVAIEPSWKIVAAGFFLFRFFDVVKLFPARWAERKMPGGWGITMDDVFAGIYAHLVLRVLLHFNWLSIAR